MATLTSQVKLDVSGITSDAISVDKTFNFTTVSGGITSRSIDDNSAAGEKILEADDYASGSIVYLRNREAAGGIVITIQLSAAVAGEIILQGQEWAVFPWTGAVDILAFSASGAPVLEIGVFSTL
tara:strand:- start:4980 stop:5354 length:375 start_codon:yes stop_codon:yes gene_type:complete